MTDAQRRILAVAAALAALAAYGAGCAQPTPPEQTAAVSHESPHPDHRTPQAADPSAGVTDAIARAERTPAKRAARTKPRPRPTPAPPARRASAGGGDVWSALANCEASAGQDSSDGRYHGFFQFRLDTWRSVGESGDPHTYSYEHQRAAAQRLQARSGWGQWPACSQRIGAR